MKYFNKRNGKVAKLVSHDDKFKTSILEFEDGSTTNITDATIKRWWKVVEDDEVTEEVSDNKLVQMPGTDGEWGKEHYAPEEDSSEDVCSDGTPYTEVMQEIVADAKERASKVSKKPSTGKSKTSSKKVAKRGKKELEPYVQESLDFICEYVASLGDEIFIPAGGIKMKAFKVGGHMYCKFTYSCSSINVAVQSKAMPDKLQNPDKIANHMFNHVYTFDSKLSASDKKLIQKLLSNARNYRIGKNSEKEDK